MIITAELIVAFVGAVSGIIVAVIAAIVSFRKAKPEMKKIAAEADEIQTRVLKTQYDTIESTIAMLDKRVTSQNIEIEQLHKARQDTRDAFERRIYDMECEMGKLREAKDRTDQDNDKLRFRVRELESKVIALETELTLWTSGKKKKTGPLQ